VENRSAGVRIPRRPVRRRKPGRLLRTRWPVAVAEVAVAIAVGLILPRTEIHFRWSDGVSYDVGTAQATLGAIAAGMITLTGFVLTAVTLIVQTVQNQSPRLMRMVDRTDKTPILFGTFTATFTFALVVLSQVRENAVPDVSVLVSLLLLLVSVGLLLRLLATFRTTLTTGGLARAVGHELREVIDVMYPARFDPDASAAAARNQGKPLAASTWLIRHVGVPGVFQAFDEQAVVRLAAGTGTEIRFLPGVGDFLPSGARLAAGTGPAPDAAKLRRLVGVGPLRTMEQDPAYGIRLLVDIALRALSPAINDPTSAVQALDQLDDVMQRLTRRSLGDGRLLDAAGRVLVRFPAPRWDAFVALAFDEIIVNGAGSIQVTRRLRALLDDLISSAPPTRRPPVSARIATLQRAIRGALADETIVAEAMEPDHQGIGSPRARD
jgi:uncharacterized membrane protein